MQAASQAGVQRLAPGAAASVVRIAWGTDMAEHDAEAQLHQLRIRFPAATIEISACTGLHSSSPRCLHRAPHCWQGAAWSSKSACATGEIQAALASLLSAGLRVAALLGFWQAAGQHPEQFAQQAACLTRMLQKEAAIKQAASDADWQALQPAAATLLPNSMGCSPCRWRPAG